MENVVIIGTGPAGYTAAIYAARANLNPLIIAGKLPGGQLTQTTDIENFPGFPGGVQGYELMFNMQKQAEEFGTRILNELVVKADFKAGGPQKLELASGEVIESKAVIIATGASPRWLGLESEQRLMTKGVTACATCDGAFYRNVPVVVVGGGDTALEEASFMTRFASKVYLVHRRDQFRGSKIMADRVKANEKIEIVWDSVIEEILGADEVEAVRVRNVKTDETKEIEVKAYFAALGHIPNTELFKDYVDTDETGYFVLDGHSSKTKTEGVFIAGDCADHEYRQAITAAGMGCKAAIDTERWLESQNM